MTKSAIENLQKQIVENELFFVPHENQAINLLLRSPENSARLFFDSEPKQEGEFFTFTVSNKDGTERWKHWLKTEEI